MASPWASMIGNRNAAKTLDEKFWAKAIVGAPGECWGWRGSRSGGTHGRGRIWHDGRFMVASRVSWLIHRGAIPQDMYVLHRCDNPPCVNPDHLFLGTLSDNAQDMWDKDRGPWPRRRA